MPRHYKQQNQPTPQRHSVDPVKTEGTTEVPLSSFLANDGTKERYDAMEEQKDKDIKRLRKESDGKPKL